MPQSSIASWLLPKNPPEPSPVVEPGDTAPKSEVTGCTEKRIEAKATASAATPKLPIQARIQPLDDEHMLYFQRLNALLLPIPYQSSFYKETQYDPVVASLTKIATWQCDDCSRKMSPVANKFMRESTTSSPQLVAAIRCRLIPADPSKPTAQDHSLYISTIGTLAPFRGHGLAGQLLKQVMRTAVEQYGVHVVTAHVWEEHDEALAWYKKRGFQVIRKEKGYYRRLAPKTDAWVIRKDIQPSDLIS